MPSVKRSFKPLYCFLNINESMVDPVHRLIALERQRIRTGVFTGR